MDAINFWISLAAAILAGTSIVLHVVAPRTKTTVDDRLVAKVDELLALLRPPAPAPSPTLTVVNTSPPVVFLALVVFGLSGAQLGCSSGQRTAVAHAVVDCTAASSSAIGETLANMKAPKADGGCFTPATLDKPAHTDWGCVEAHAIGAGLAIGGCAFLEVVTDRSPGRAVASALSPPDPAGRSAFEGYRGRVAGGATFHTAAGDR